MSVRKGEESQGYSVVEKNPPRLLEDMIVGPRSHYVPRFPSR